MRQEAVAAAFTDATLLSALKERKPPDSELIGGLRDLDERLVHVEVMKESATRELERLNSQIEFHREKNEAWFRERGRHSPPGFFPRSSEQWKLICTSICTRRC